MTESVPKPAFLKSWRPGIMILPWKHCPRSNRAWRQRA